MHLSTLAKCQVLRYTLNILLPISEIQLTHEEHKLIDTLLQFVDSVRQRSIKHKNKPGLRASSVCVRACECACVCVCACVYVVLQMYDMTFSEERTCRVKMPRFVDVVVNIENFKSNYKYIIIWGTFDPYIVKS